MQLFFFHAVFGPNAACVQHHAAYSKSELCALELGKLMPHMDDGWAHFMKMTQQLS